MSSTTYLSFNPELGYGSVHSNFEVMAQEKIPELSGVAYVFKHQPSSARLLWIATDDINRSFSIAFKTPPVDDTGVFHILEHSVLCGSRRYPVKEPFVNLLKTSMQTFLNALTFPDKTMYPVASTNVDDLENLMSVYLDAVFHPNIYVKPQIFKQEGWHFELEDTKGELGYNGVVFNEMKGALSDPDDVMENAITRQLFPQSAYGCESGGNPRAIPTLTYDAFIDTHARHYTLANSYTILYGDLDIERELAFIDEHFQQVDTQTQAPPNPLVRHKAHTPALVTQTMATTPENAAVGLAYVMGDALDRERMLAAEILLDTLMGSNEAPLKRRILEAGFGDDVVVSRWDAILQPFFTLILKGAHEGVAQDFRALVEETCRDLVEQGLPHEKLEASLAQAEFSLREGDFGAYPNGIVYAMQAMATWLYDDEHAVDYLHYEKELAQLRAGLSEGYFERLLDELICSSNYNACVELVPTDEGDAVEESQELARIKEGLSVQELEALIQETTELHEEQSRPDTPEALATLPQLHISDITDAVPEPPQMRYEATLPCTYHDIDTHKISYLYAYFGLDGIAFEDLPYVSVLTELLGGVATAEHSADELDTLLTAKLGSLNFFTEREANVAAGGKPCCLLVMGASALSENNTWLAQLPAEIWSSSLFNDKERIKTLLQQQRIGFEQSFIGAGHAAAMGRASSYFSDLGVLSEQMGGVDYYLFLRDLLQNYDERFELLKQKLEEISRVIFRTSNVEVSFTGSKKALEEFWGAAQTMRLSDKPQAPSILSIPAPTPKKEAFIIPSDVNYVAQAADGALTGASYSGSWVVGSKALTLSYLWDEVRVKGGAYGCGFRCTPQKTLLQFFSYRDPNIDATVERFENAAQWLKSWQPAADEFEGYVVSTVAAHDAPEKPRMSARKQDIRRIVGHPDDWPATIRAQELATSPEDVKAFAEHLSALTDPQAICVFGNQAAIKTSALDFSVCDLLS